MEANDERTGTEKESKNRREQPRDLTIVSTTRGDEGRERRERERGDSTPFVILVIVTIVIVVIVVTVYPARASVLERRVRWNNDRPSSAPLTSLLLSPLPPCVYPFTRGRQPHTRVHTRAHVHVRVYI